MPGLKHMNNCGVLNRSGQWRKGWRCWWVKRDVNAWSHDDEFHDGKHTSESGVGKEREHSTTVVVLHGRKRQIDSMDCGRRTTGNRPNSVPQIKYAHLGDWLIDWLIDWSLLKHVTNVHARLEQQWQWIRHLREKITTYKNRNINTHKTKILYLCDWQIKLLTWQVKLYSPEWLIGKTCSSGWLAGITSDWYTHKITSYVYFETPDYSDTKTIWHRPYSLIWV